MSSSTAPRCAGSLLPSLPCRSSSPTGRFGSAAGWKGRRRPPRLRSGSGSWPDRSSTRAWKRSTVRSCTERKRAHQRQFGANNRYEISPHKCFRGKRGDYYPGRIDPGTETEAVQWHSLYLAHSAHRRGIPWHGNEQAATGVNHSYVPAGDVDQVGVLQAASKMGEHLHAFWCGAGSKRGSRLSQNARRQTVNIAATRYSGTERYEVNSTVL